MAQTTGIATTARATSPRRPGRAAAAPPHSFSTSARLAAAPEVMPSSPSAHAVSSATAVGQRNESVARPLYRDSIPTSVLPTTIRAAGYAWRSSSSSASVVGFHQLPPPAAAAATRSGDGGARSSDGNSGSAAAAAISLYGVRYTALPRAVARRRRRRDGRQRARRRPAAAPAASAPPWSWAHVAASRRRHSRRRRSRRRRGRRRRRTAAVSIGAGRSAASRIGR